MITADVGRGNGVVGGRRQKLARKSEIQTEGGGGGRESGRERGQGSRYLLEKEEEVGVQDI